MLIATLQADLLRGARFKNCKRSDCSTPFPVFSTGHKKKYCSWSCAHVVSVRKGRKKKLKEGRKDAKKR
jgi:CGNR zinc finger